MTQLLDDLKDLASVFQVSKADTVYAHAYNDICPDADHNRSWDKFCQL